MLLFPNRDGDGVLAANKNELAALSKGCRRWCWCWGPGCWRCELAERAFKTGRCRQVAVQAAHILVPASCMSTGRGILPSYLGLCWWNSFAKAREGSSKKDNKKKLDDEWPESIFHHVGSLSASYLLSVQYEVLSQVS